MKIVLLTLLSVALVAADVSHLFGHDHDHHHHHHEHGEAEHPGYNYDAPQIPFELPKASYLPPAQPKPAYLPPVTPKSVYLPPATRKPVYFPPAQPKSVYIAPVVEQPLDNYLPPVLPSFTIPIPSYAAPLELTNNYLPPQDFVEPHSDDGYHYEAPSKPFFY